MKKVIRPAIFKWRQTEPGLILCAVRWSLRPTSNPEWSGYAPVVSHESADASGCSSVVVEQPIQSRPTTDTAFALGWGSQP